ncbi:unnamed protein product [Rodentolepis nana]|uniref:Trafficking protein particle complex subunit n=1 Tax=Rodentolepis nana TaxID=102285 RepID=A0A0R3TPJ9_RODNA|nr:unnamed protein product [Rodentolepis nana]
MKFLNMYIFDVRGNNVFYKEWVTLKASNSKENDAKLMRGMLVGLKALCSRLSSAENDIYTLSYKTNRYRLHYFEGPTGLKIFLTSEPSLPPLYKELENVYKLFVEYVVKSPGYDSTSPVSNSLFVQKLDEWAQNLS